MSTCGKLVAILDGLVLLDLPGPTWISFFSTFHGSTPVTMIDEYGKENKHTVEGSKGIVASDNDDEDDD